MEIGRNVGAYLGGAASGLEPGCTHQGKAA
jgi:hypothetical protein